MKCDLKIGDFVYRLVNLHDGGGIAPQFSCVAEIDADTVTVKFGIMVEKMKMSEYGTRWSKDEKDLTYAYDIRI